MSNPFVAVLMDRHHDLLDYGRPRRYVEPVGVLDHAIHQRPWCLVRTRYDLATQNNKHRVGVMQLSQLHDEVEALCGKCN